MPHHPPTHLQQLVRSSDVARRMKAELNQASPQLVGGDRLVVVGVHGTEQLDFTARNDNTRDCTTSHGQNSAMGLYAIGEVEHDNFPGKLIFPESCRAQPVSSVA
jgi:hypothetical protein